MGSVANSDMAFLRALSTQAQDSGLRAVTRGMLFCSHRCSTFVDDPELRGCTSERGGRRREGYFMSKLRVHCVYFPTIHAYSRFYTHSRFSWISGSHHKWNRIRGGNGPYVWGRTLFRRWRH